MKINVSKLLILCCIAGCLLASCGKEEVMPVSIEMVLSTEPVIEEVEIESTIDETQSDTEETETVMAETTDTAWKYADVIDETVVNIEGDFHTKIENNPIDADFTCEDNGTENRIRRARAYCDAWIAEIDNSLLVLEEYLTEEDYEMICASYEGWKQYLENSFNVEQSIFYPFSTYLGEGYYLAGGSLTYPIVMEVTAVRARNYAIEIKSLEYIFTEEVEFVYGK